MKIGVLLSLAGLLPWVAPSVASAQDNQILDYINRVIPPVGTACGSPNSFCSIKFVFAANTLPSKCRRSAIPCDRSGETLPILDCRRQGVPTR